MEAALIVSSDSFETNKIRDIVATAGFDVASIDSGLAALWSIQAQAPDLVIAGQSIGGMTGADLVAQLRVTPGFALTFVVCITSNDEAARALEAGASAVVSSSEKLALLLDFIKLLVTDQVSSRTTIKI